MKMNTEIISKYNMLPEGSKVLCAVSGGADSMCLLYLLLSMKEKLGICLAAAHFEHGLRGEESLRDARFVENFCHEQGIEFIMEHGNVLSYSKDKGMSTEEAARELRYDFLNRAAKKLLCDKIATAHNADDNAETVIFNLCRGSGSTGLRGIPPVRDNIIRPLLCCTRAEIEEYLKENSVPYVEDSSNFSDDYSRNVIRHKIMPVLRGINPKVSDSAFRSSELMRQDEKCLSDMAQSFIKRYYDGESIKADKLLNLPEAVSSRVIRQLCPRTLSYRHVEDALKLCRGNGLAFADLPGIRLRREQGRIYFGAQAEEHLNERLIVPGQAVFVREAGIIIKSSIEYKNEEVNDLFKTYFFKYESICGNIFLTGRKSGDNIRPVGRSCTKSLKKLFTEAGYTERQKNLTPVFRDEKGVLAVYGMAVSERCRAAAGDKILRIEIEKMQGDRENGERH